LKNTKDNFLIGRLKSVRFSLHGIWLLVTTETNIKIQLIIAIITVVLGFYFNISAIEWLIQTMMIAIVLVAESLNTGIEKLSDIVHSDYHEKIKVVKDISAGAVGIAAIISLFVGGIIYIPKIALLF
jgi:diacylglycerol kinase (ATP)